MTRIFALAFALACVMGGLQAQAALTSNGTSLNGVGASIVVVGVELPAR